ncbi:MAG TPA: hypothetical protein VGJ20_46445 [Xanthobacteraceae bacterium]|jgi:hypothetical protein
MLLKINVVCLLLAVIGTAAIVKHPEWFGSLSLAAQPLAKN